MTATAWFGVTVLKNSLQDIQPLETILERTGLGEKTFSNPGDLKISEQAEKLLPDVVHKAQDWMKEVRKSFENELNPKLNDHLQRLEALKGRHKREIQLYFDEQNIAETLKKRRKDEKTGKRITKPCGRSLSKGCTKMTSDLCSWVIILPSAY